jgi:Fe-Mn family superoxide dismutase
MQIMSYSFIRNFITESGPESVSIKPLPYSKTDLSPAISKDTLEYHYEHLAKTYAERYNKGEGDSSFNEAGVFLHNILFQQYCESTGSKNKPEGKILEFIKTHFKSFDKFKESFEKEAMAIQGSGWVYLAKDGKIKTITNHAIKKDIVVLVDWWEHAWALDYQWDKEKYLDNVWKIIDWDVCNERL